MKVFHNKLFKIVQVFWTSFCTLAFQHCQKKLWSLRSAEQRNQLSKTSKEFLNNRVRVGDNSWAGDFTVKKIAQKIWEIKYKAKTSMNNVDVNLIPVFITFGWLDFLMKP